MQAINNEAAASVVNREVQRHLSAAAQGIFARPVLQRALTYAQQVPLQFLQVVLPSQVGPAVSNACLVYSVYCQLPVSAPMPQLSFAGVLLAGSLRRERLTML